MPESSSGKLRISRGFENTGISVSNAWRVAEGLAMGPTTDAPCSLPCSLRSSARKKSSSATSTRFPSIVLPLFRLMPAFRRWLDRLCLGLRQSKRAEFLGLFLSIAIFGGRDLLHRHIRRRCLS